VVRLWRVVVVLAAFAAACNGGDQVPEVITSSPAAAATTSSTVPAAGAMIPADTGSELVAAEWEAGWCSYVCRWGLEFEGTEVELLATDYRETVAAATATLTTPAQERLAAALAALTELDDLDQWIRSFDDYGSPLSTDIPTYTVSLNLDGRDVYGFFETSITLLHNESQRPVPEGITELFEVITDLYDELSTCSDASELVILVGACQAAPTE